MLSEKIEKRLRMEKFSKCERKKNRIVFPYCERSCGNCASFLHGHYCDTGYCQYNKEEMECGDVCDDWLGEEIYF